MRHWIVDPGAQLLPNWRAAMPAATLVGRLEPRLVPPLAAGIVWIRLRDGTSLATALSGATPGTGQKLVILADDPDPALVMQALAAGAAGCCNTHAAPAVLQQVALVVSNGGLWIGQSLLQQVVGSTSRLLARRQSAITANEGWAAVLSERERQVARLVAGGASNREVADRLAISERTAKAHLTSIFEKLEVRDRLQLALRVNAFAPPDR
jgi:DNA-binding NarL/FixJ family response regulator